MWWVINIDGEFNANVRVEVRWVQICGFWHKICVTLICRLYKCGSSVQIQYVGVFYPHLATFFFFPQNQRNYPKLFLIINVPRSLSVKMKQGYHHWKNKFICLNMDLNLLCLCHKHAQRVYHVWLKSSF